MRPDTLGVIGLGAIGGSVAWQAARNGVRRVLGFSPQPKETLAAVRAGAITEAAPSARFVADHADLVVIATPPGAALHLIDRLAPRLRAGPAWCTDVASVKQPIAKVASDLGLQRFAGSHPFAGTHLSGFAAAVPDRFRDVLVYVTPIGDDDTAAREIAHFWSSVLEAAPVITGAAEHDELAAWTSHLPQAVASALATAIAEAGPRGVTYGSGARDTTRLAASNIEMWRDVLLLNRSAVLRTLDRYEETLGALRRALTCGSPDDLAAWLRAGARWRRRLGK